ncbi:hypothetical protein [Pelagibacterium lacus]|uniref:Uncharacterized protein n=1 Tax=Pelagibacterium lacus TaxID=2282655 RepID=A0A369W1M5_9HYPH|nr:hypothetical protein [Pelagibacterium lacus]RDE08263.1 hypothetical protein DVH29_12590 [Pelagibacterium lacus]
MADYRELLRKAIDALPDNTGANRRAVYEKARTALVTQLRAIEPPLPAREITTHRLALEDCIREVEHEATERLLGRFRAVEAEEAEELVPEPEASEVEIEPEIEPEPEPKPDVVEDDFVVADAPPDDDFPQEPEPDLPEAAEDAPAGEDDRFDVEAPSREPEPPDAQGAEEGWDVEPRMGGEPEFGDHFEDFSEDQPAEPVEPVWDPSGADAAADAINAEAQRHEQPEPQAPGYGGGSIEDIIAAAELASAGARQEEVEASEADALETEDEPAPREEARVIPFATPHRDDPTAAPEERHFLLSEAEIAPVHRSPLVDLHGRPLSVSAPDSVPGTAMSSVREVDVEPDVLKRPEISDAQVAIDRAIAALDREAQGSPAQERSDEDAAPIASDAGMEPEDDAEARDDRSGGGPGALTIFLLISVLLLVGGGAAGYWAWQQGYIDLNSVFAQGDTPPTTEVAATDLPSEATPAETPGTVPAPSATNTTPEVPVAPGEVDGSALPGGEPVATETPATNTGQPEASFEDRLPAEADEPLDPANGATEQPAVVALGQGLQSLLLEEQPSGMTGAVPYSGSVEWSRGTDELGNPTIVANASIPARNLDVEVLIRRNGDANLPASHLMEVKFDVAESFIGGSIANLPGVLLKDEELVQGQPLTGASARIVGNSFLFALSSASEIDVQNNIGLLTDRGWMDLAMVYGTGRRAIMTLEKGEEGSEIFNDVLDAWAALDAAANGSDAADSPGA